MQLIMQKLIRYMPLIAVSFLASCEDVCYHSGGVRDGNKVCQCEVYYSENECKTRWPDVLENSVNPQDLIRIQYVGKSHGVQMGSERSGDILDGINALKQPTNIFKATLINSGDSFFIKIPKLGLAVSIPNYPSKVSGSWADEGCTFEAISSEISPIQTKEEQYAFRGICKNDEIETLYWTNRHLNLVAFKINEPKESIFINREVK